MKGQCGEPLDRSHLAEFTDPKEAAKGAHLITTDVWTSMGYEAETDARKTRVQGLHRRCGIDEMCGPGGVVHALPARASRRGSGGRGHRRTAIGGMGRGRNRLHVQKALMEFYCWDVSMRDNLYRRNAVLTGQSKQSIGGAIPGVRRAPLGTRNPGKANLRPCSTGNLGSSSTELFVEHVPAHGVQHENAF